MFYCCWFGQGRGPHPNSKKKHAPAQTAKNIKTPPFLPSVLFCFFCCLGGWTCFFFAVWAGGRVFFAVWAGACLFVCCLGGWRVYVFAVWAGGAFLFAVWAGTGVHSLTGLPGSSLSNPTTKKTKQQRKHGFLRHSSYKP